MNQLKILACVMGLLAIMAVCGCGSSGGADAMNSILGTWKGTATSRAPGDVKILQMQFKRGTSTDTFTGTIVEIVTVSIIGVNVDVPYADGSISGTFDPSTNKVTMTIVWNEDANGNPNHTTTVNWSGDFSVVQDAMSGTYTGPSAVGDITLNRVSTAAQPNLNVTGTWIGDPTQSAGGYFQGTNPLTDQNQGSRYPGQIVYVQDTSNHVTATVNDVSPSGSPYTTVATGSVTGNLVLVNGNLPASAGVIPNVPLYGDVPLAGRLFEYDATVDSSTATLTQGGHIRIKFNTADKNDLVGGTWFDIGNFQVNFTTTGGIIVPIK